MGAVGLTEHGVVEVGADGEGLVRRQGPRRGRPDQDGDLPSRQFRHLFGERAGNFAVQNADLLLVIGSRMSIPQTGYNATLFARHAKIVMVDIDENEMFKQSLKVDVPIVADAKKFMTALLARLDGHKPSPAVASWAARCRDWKRRYPLVLDEYDYTFELGKAKRLLGERKAGHTGTLDPLATGVLPLCFGAATKFSQQHLDADKVYETTVRLGITTSTADVEGIEQPVFLAGGLVLHEDVGVKVC